MRTKLGNKVRVYSGTEEKIRPGFVVVVVVVFVVGVAVVVVNSY